MPGTSINNKEIEAQQEDQAALPTRQKTLISLVDKQMSDVLSTYSEMPAIEKARCASNHSDKIGWKELAKRMEKHATRCKQIYGHIGQRLVYTNTQTADETERLYKAIAFFQKQNG